MDEDAFQIFSDDDGLGRSTGLEGVIAMCRHWVEEHGMGTAEALGILFDMIRPGQSENSHDVKGVFMGALYAYGYGYLSHSFNAVYINVMPWGVGFTISTDMEFNYENLTKGEREVIIKGLAVILRSGGMEAEVKDNLIVITSPDGEEMESVDIDEVVSRFTKEIDAELGESTPEPKRKRDPDDPTDKWQP